MDFPVADLHTDALTSRLSALELTNLWGDSPLQCACLAVWGTEFLSFPAQFLAKFQELRALLPSRRLLLCYEDIHYATEENLDELLDAAPFYCSLTWNGENALAGGAHSCGRLTPLGRRVLRGMEERGVLTDTAHLNRESFFDVIDAARRAPICSHTCFDAVRRHPRNLGEDQLRALTDRGGLVGLTLVGDFLAESGHADAEVVLRHIDYFVSRFDWRLLALGTDFFGTENLPENIKSYETLSLLVEKLFKIGYNGTVIEGLLHGNLQAFLSKEQNER